MRSIESDWWVIDLPAEWEAEQDEETIVLTDQDGVGVLEITTLRREDAGKAVDLASIAQDLVPAGVAPKPCRLAGQLALCFAYIEDDAAVRDWLTATDEWILLATYSCALEDRGLDDVLIDEVLETLEFKRELDIQA